MILKETFQFDDIYVPKGSRKKVEEAINSIYPNFAEKIESDPTAKVHYLGSVGRDQYRTARALIEGTRYLPDSRYERNQYTPTEGDKKLADEIKANCFKKPCAVTIRGEDKSRKYSIALNYEFPASEAPDEPIHVHCYGPNEMNPSFTTLDDAKAWIIDQGKKGECLFNTIQKIEYTIHPTSNQVIFTENQSKVQFLRLIK